MDIFSHFLIGVLISVVFLNALGEEFAIYAGIMAVLADFDFFLEFFKSSRRSHLMSHKGASHSYFTGLIVSLITGGIFTLMTGFSNLDFNLETFLLAWLVGFLFYSLHVTLDALAASKIPLLYPFSKKRFRIFIDRAINPILALISGSILMFYLITYLFFREVFYSEIFYLFIAFYFIYLAYRLLTKIWLKLRLPKNNHYIPGFFPFSYFIYENNTNETTSTFTLFKKIQFLPRTKKIIETEIRAESEEIEYFMRAKTLSKNYPFFSKWENIIPIITKNDTKIFLILFLAESFASGNAYSLQVVFNRRSKEIEYYSDGFGKIFNNSL
ncbi:MAG: metal-dependent hydrolase [Candidatus Hermodarchaeota archaeon]